MDESKKDVRAARRRGADTGSALFQLKFAVIDRRELSVRVQIVSRKVKETYPKNEIGVVLDVEYQAKFNRISSRRESHS